MPASAHAFFFERTYVSESLRSPTSTTARPGTLSVLFIAATFARTSSRTVSAMALPSVDRGVRARGARENARGRTPVPRRRRGAGAESFQPGGW